VLVAYLVVLLNMAIVLQDNQPKNLIVHPATIAGPWECVAQDGIHGFFIKVEGSGPSPTSSIRVYRRQNAREDAESFVPGKPYADSVALDDDHLDIRFTGLGYPNPFSISLTFDTAAQRWTGKWSACSKRGQAILTRPHMESGNENPIVGDWKGKANATPWSTPGSLHIRQSSDGVLIAWLDREFGGGRNGELLKILSTGPSSVELETTFGIGANYKYTGTLSPDAKYLKGTWHVGNSRGMSLQAPDDFERE
jgi:hypothetical protein